MSALSMAIMGRTDSDVDQEDDEMSNSTSSQAFMTDTDLEKVLLHREYMVHPCHADLAKLTGGPAFGLLRPTQDAKLLLIGHPDGSVPSLDTACNQDVLRTLHVAKDVRPFAKLAQTNDMGNRMLEILCE
eukprot:CAMPEP_0206320606 /NCGR_PEP_ID=MMETSP0106_2-20121207/18417_1 /ASSEMBLY_ACC=CAM_ASM_000206 /TAXON_ID=81532 /ORGANISM="Acanthoeca-like sp., Strain 10tr" /LENGTH=129 /DNA_ID=CAMNT_0053752593 /DNA_START=400 /DNA_END=786 /DNA_ORIENTATION=-